MANPIFSIIIPTYDDWSRLLLCLDALKKQTIPATDFEIIVVNNATVHKLPNNISLPNDVILCHEPEPGSYAARNHGAEIARGDILAFTDSDCIPDKNWLSYAAEVFSSAECSLIGGEVDIFKPPGGQYLTYIYEKREAFQQKKDVKKGKSVTANLFIKRTVFEVLNGFNQKIKSGGDWEFTQRAVKNGYKMVYSEKVRVLHPARKCVRELFKKHRRLTAWGYLNTKRDYQHSDIRILGSVLKGGFRDKFRPVLHGKLSSSNILAGLISLLLFVYRIYLLILIFTGILKPERIRE